MQNTDSIKVSGLGETSLKYETHRVGTFLDLGVSSKLRDCVLWIYVDLFRVQQQRTVIIANA